MSGFEVSVSKEQLKRIRERYEYLRKTEEYRGLRVKKAFQPTAILNELEERARDKITVEDRFFLELGITFSTVNDETKWREYGSTLQRLFAALAKGAIAPDMKMKLTSMGQALGFDVSSEITTNEGGKEEAVKQVCRALSLFLYPDSIRYANEPLRLS